MGLNSSSSEVDRKILELEVNLLKNLQVCPSNIQEEINEEDKNILLDRINEFVIKDELDDRFFDYRLMNALSCLYGNLWLVDKELFEASDDTKDYFELKENLSIGVAGTVLSANRKGTNMNFIIKSTRPRKSHAIGIHETFIGIFVTNKLRQYCANFSYVYGGFTCGSIDISNRRICEGPLKVPYIIYENIAGKSLHIHNIEINQNINIDKFNFDDLAGGILQIYLSLRLAYYKAHSFSHGDSHSMNIIMRPLKRKTTLKYEVNGKFYYIYSNYVATLIDYGMSQIFLRNKDNEIRMGIGNDNNIVHFKYLSNIQDILKTLGWVVLYFNNQKYKEIYVNILIEFINPNMVNKSFDAKVHFIKEMSIKHFNVNADQLALFNNGIINIEKFLNIFNKYYPKNELDKFFIASDIERNDLQYPMFECDGKCKDECETINEILTPNPVGQSNDAFKSSFSTASSYINQVNKSLMKFKNVKDYNVVLENQLKEAEKIFDQNFISQMNARILENIRNIKLWISNVNISNIYNYLTKYNANMKLLVREYEKFVSSWINTIKLLRESIDYNNTLSLSGFKSIYKQELLNIMNLINEIQNVTINPIKEYLIKLYDSNTFRSEQGSFYLNVLNRLSTKLILDPIY